MKRPPGIWILLSAGVLWLSLQDVYGIRATALIFGKTTTTTTPPSPVPNVTDGSLGVEVVTNSSSENSNSTKPPLTGIPQIDYLTDPNLPQELNGYNLSEYPFYERVPDPDEIDFKCDGLHDGFYASIPYKCQVYHHCLFGTRFDFLCANYTAFDQKTFICQFVSDVDCVGSKKFWHRNDALYQAASTTTQKPLNIHTTSTEANSNSGQAGGGHRGSGKRRRPAQRRPHFDYYDYADYDDDYYEDRARPRRRRPRPRPRPVYDDEYEDYEEGSIEKSHRRPYNRRGGSERRRNKNRNKNRETLSQDEEDIPNTRKKISEDDDEVYRPKGRRKPVRDDEYEDERPRDEKRKPEQDEIVEDETANERRKPFRDEERTGNKRKPVRDEDLEDDYDVRPQRSRKGSRRPSADDEYEDDLPKSGDRRENRPRKKFEDNDADEEESQPLIKPTTGTIYDRPRVAPRIKPPVPKNKADKYAYKPIAKITTASSIHYDEYYDDYEEDTSPKISKNKRVESDSLKAKSSENEERKAPSRSRITTTLDEEDDALTLPKVVKSKPEVSRGKDRYRSRTQTKTTEEPDIEEVEQPKRINFKKPTHSSTERNNRDKATRVKPIEPEYYDDDYEIEKTSEQIKVSTTETSRKKWKPSSSEAPTESLTHKRSTTVRTTLAPSSTERSTENNRDQLVKIVKRPFLPSRGGNPYSSRGLQPVGHKALKPEVVEQSQISDVQQKPGDIRSDNRITFKLIQKENDSQNFKANRQKNKEYNNTASITENKTDLPNKTQRNEEVVKQYAKQKFREPISQNDDDFKPIKRPQHILMPHRDANNHNGPRTTQKPKVPERDPLDIYDNEYDVTLNDALNPTLPNLPVRSNFPTGFSPAKDYTFSAFQRPRYVQEPVINSANTDFIYQPQEPATRQRYELAPQSYNSRDQFVAPTNEFRNYFSPVASSNANRGLTQAHTQRFYGTSY